MKLGEYDSPWLRKADDLEETPVRFLGSKSWFYLLLSGEHGQINLSHSFIIRDAGNDANWAHLPGLLWGCRETRCAEQVAQDCGHSESWSWYLTFCSPFPLSSLAPFLSSPTLCISSILSFPLSLFSFLKEMNHCIAWIRMPLSPASYHRSAASESCDHIEGSNSIVCLCCGGEWDSVIFIHHDGSDLGFLTTHWFW